MGQVKEGRKHICGSRVATGFVSDVPCTIKAHCGRDLGMQVTAGTALLQNV